MPNLQACCWGQRFTKIDSAKTATLSVERIFYWTLVYSLKVCHWKLTRDSNAPNMYFLNIMCESYKRFKVVLVDGPNPTQMPDVMVVGTLTTNTLSLPKNLVCWVWAGSWFEHYLTHLLVGNVVPNHTFFTPHPRETSATKARWI